LIHQRWFGAREETIRQVRIADAVRLQAEPIPIYLTILDVSTDRDASQYLLPLTLTPESEAREIMEHSGYAAIAWVETPSDRGLLHDATVRPDFWISLFRWWRGGGKGRSLRGVYVASMDADAKHESIESARVLAGEQTNSSAIIDDRFFIKLYRRLEEGVNPEMELLRCLTEQGFKFVPQLYGRMSFRTSRHQYALGILQDALPVETDGWSHALEITGRFLERVSQMTPPRGGLPTSYEAEVPGWLDEVAPEMLSLSHVLGIRTAELHLTLSRSSEPDIAPVDGAAADIEALVGRIRSEAAETRAMLSRKEGDLPGIPRASEWDVAMQRLEQIASIPHPQKKIRIHGDLHLGQVVIADGDYYILDFEGEPDRTLEVRRERDFAMR